MNDRIRWEHVDGTVTSWFGYVGTRTTPLFQILHPVASKPDARTQFHKWALAATFTDEVRYPETAEGAQAALKDEAERWLEEFTASLGVEFTIPADAAFPGSDGWPGRGWVYAGRDRDGNLILKHEESGGLYHVIPEEDL